ncbi:MAG: proline--tRNA ligase [Patescibacteria group bacterium]
MKLSKSFAQTLKNLPSGEVSKNAQLLIKAGYIHKTMAGVYSYLPLGLKVLNNIENIIRKHLNRIGGQEVLMNSLHPKTWWDKTDRWDPEKVDVLFRLESQTNSKYALACSHEEQVTPIIQSFVSSYKDLPEYIDNADESQYPLSVYQIQTKFRDELRSKSGLMRGREFRMKDMYDFHISQESADKYYELVKDTYFKIYAEMGLKVYAVYASGGMFTDNDSHEFQVLCEAGEDEIFIHKDKIYNSEIVPVYDDKVNLLHEEEQELTQHELHDVVGVEALIKELNIEITRSTKTIMYEDSNGKLIVACIRSDRDLSIEKLEQIAKRRLKLAAIETIRNHTGAETGYAGIINLPNNCELYCDDSVSKLKNFETGSNKTGFHATNVCFERDLPYPERFYDIKKAIKGDKNPSNNQFWEVGKSAEVGNIFKLGSKYTEAFDLKVTTKDNNYILPIMNCHGIGTSRCMGVLAEIYSDDQGLKWPENIAPFKFHLITHIQKNESQEVLNKIQTIARQVYSGEIQIDMDKLMINTFNGEQDSYDEVIWDDRSNIGMGEKLGDAELIGCPYIILVTKKSLEGGGIEVRLRSNNQVKILSV